MQLSGPKKLQYIPQIFPTPTLEDNFEISTKKITRKKHA
jgi:hypothetical protein